LSIAATAPVFELGAFEHTLRMKWTVQQSETTRRTPLSPRFLRPLRNSSQPAGFVLFHSFGGSNDFAVPLALIAMATSTLTFLVSPPQLRLSQMPSR